MDEKQFWTLLETTRPEGDDEGGEEHAEALGDALSDLTTGEVAAFGKLFAQKLAELYTWDLWGVAYMLLGGCSDDGFEYFRAAVLSRGERAYHLALDEPEALGLMLCEEEPEELDAEALLYVAADVYEEQTGEDLEELLPETPEDPRGQEWEEDDLDGRYPRLALLVE